MIARWWQTLGRRREARAAARRAIPDALWGATLARLPFIARRDAETLARLRRMASLFLDSKEFNGAQGFVVSDEIAVAVAVQACLPVLELGLDQYDAFVGIVMHADLVRARREVMDEHGVVHEWHEELAGEAMDGGPLMLSWADVLPSTDDTQAALAYNVVIHEFAHVLDMGDGAPDGVPPLASTAERDAWIAVIDPAFDAFCAEVDSGRETLLDPYGATDIGEFFAVATETFFVSPKELRAEHPGIYGLLARYFQQDPASFAGR